MAFGLRSRRFVSSPKVFQGRDGACGQGDVEERAVSADEGHSELSLCVWVFHQDESSGFSVGLDDDSERA